MDKQQLSNALHVGGTLEDALSGNYKLSASSVIQEGMKLTQKHFWRFLPAITALVIVNVFIFIATLSLLIPSPSDFIEGVLGQREMTEELLRKGQIAVFISTILSAPLYAGVSLMGLSHAIGFRTKPRHILKGLNYALPVIIAMTCISMIQSISREIVPLLSLFFGIAFSMTLLLICEKRLKPLEAMAVSFRSMTKKMLPLSIIYLCIGFVFLLSYMTAGLALFWALPFVFNVKGVLYREMYGVGIEITVSKEGDDDSSSDKNNKDEVFNA